LGSADEPADDAGGGGLFVDAFWIIPVCEDAGPIAGAGLDAAEALPGAIEGEGVLGSLPGVIVGSLALIGTPELLREFAEYRMMIYGAVLVAMMIFMPEGLWPESARKRELHAEREEAAAAAIEAGSVPAREEA
jgi:hypothetical protein